MTDETIVDKTIRLVEPLTNKMKFDLVDTEFVKEYSDWYLRVYIDKKGGVNIDDCEQLSRELSDALDIADFIKQSYILEISSPGLDRPLKTEADFIRYQGELLDVQLNTEKKKKKTVSGVLIERKDQILYLKDEKEQDIAIPWDDIVVVKRAIRF